MIEYLHQFDERHLRIFAACVIYLSAEFLSKRVAGEMVNLQFVAFLQLFQDNVDSLDREYAVLLAEQDVAVDRNGVNLFIALLYVSLQLWVDSDRPPLLGFAFDDGQLVLVEDLRPS